MLQVFVHVYMRQTESRITLCASGVEVELRQLLGHDVDCKHTSLVYLRGQLIIPGLG